MAINHKNCGTTDSYMNCKSIVFRVLSKINLLVAAKSWLLTYALQSVQSLRIAAAYMLGRRILWLDKWACSSE